MVGGVIIGLTHKADMVHVNVADCPHYPKHGIKAESVEGCPYPDMCCVYTDGKRVDDGSDAPLKVGDSFYGSSFFTSDRGERTCNRLICATSA